MRPRRRGPCDLEIAVFNVESRVISIGEPAVDGVACIGIDIRQERLSRLVSREANGPHNGWFNHFHKSLLRACRVLCAHISNLTRVRGAPYALVSRVAVGLRAGGVYRLS